MIKFSSWLVHSLTSAVNHLPRRGNEETSIKRRRLRMWKKFHGFAFSSAYKERWISLLQTLGMQNALHLPGLAMISQHVARIALETLITKLVSQDTTDDTVSELTTDEEQAVRYTCTAGYIVKSLKKNFLLFLNIWNF